MRELSSFRSNRFGTIENDGGKKMDFDRAKCISIFDLADDVKMSLH